MNSENQREDDAFEKRNEELENRIYQLERDLVKLTTKMCQVCDKLGLNYDDLY